MKFEPGTQRAIAVIGQDTIGTIDVLQSWIDAGWRCVALVAVNDGSGSVVAVVEAGAAGVEEADDPSPGELPSG